MLYSHDKYRAARKLLLVVVGVLTIVPLAPLINRYIPPLMVGSWNLDLVFFHCACLRFDLSYSPIIPFPHDPCPPALRGCSVL